MRLYRHADIYAKAIQRYGSKEAVAAESAKQHQKLLEWVRANSSSASGDRGSIDIRYRPDQDGKPDRKLPARLGVWARTFAIGSTPTGKVVAAAIIGNASISLSKFAAFAFTGSASMLSEGIHSLADLSNQCLLAVGLRYTLYWAWPCRSGMLMTVYHVQRVEQDARRSAPVRLCIREIR